MWKIFLASWVIRLTCTSWRYERYLNNTSSRKRGRLCRDCAESQKGADEWNKASVALPMPTSTRPALLQRLPVRSIKSQTHSIRRVSIGHKSTQLNSQ
uniref:Secreted protein n=1 Tax=Globodera rostochiensis TaxID=31243 RepID=A0A914H6H6_GLORO